MPVGQADEVSNSASKRKVAKQVLCRPLPSVTINRYISSALQTTSDIQAELKGRKVRATEEKKIGEDTRASEVTTL